MELLTCQNGGLGHPSSFIPLIFSKPTHSLINRIHAGIKFLSAGYNILFMQEITKRGVTKAPESLTLSVSGSFLTMTSPIAVVTTPSRWLYPLAISCSGCTGANKVTQVIWKVVIRKRLPTMCKTFQFSGFNWRY